MINLILFYCDRMQGFFGLGSHIEELIKYFRTKTNIAVTLIFTETEKYPECTFEQEKGIDMLYIPCPENNLFNSCDDTVMQKTLALRILQIAYPYLEDKKNMIFWFNSIAELNIAKQIKDFFPCSILYVHHGWAWKDHIKVEDAVFANEWKKGNVDFCPTAFEYMQYQLQLAKLADKIVTVTQQASNYFSSALGIPLHKLTDIYNGIQLPRNQKYNKTVLKKELGIRKEEKIVLFSGRVVINKGIFFLIEAFKLLLKKLPNCRLVLIGTGTLGEVLRKIAPVWAKVTLTEFISRDLLQKWYAVADVGILPSLMEQCSYTAIEMRFWHIPLIVSAVDGLDEMFIHEMDCLKISVAHDENGERILDSTEISDILYRVLVDKELSDRLINNSYQKAIEHFTLERMGEQYIQVLEKLAENIKMPANEKANE